MPSTLFNFPFIFIPPAIQLTPNSLSYHDTRCSYRKIHIVLGSAKTLLPTSKLSHELQGIPHRHPYSLLGASQKGAQALDYGVMSTVRSTFSAFDGEWPNWEALGMFGSSGCVCA
jgi:hypothetical protein